MNVSNGASSETQETTAMKDAVARRNIRRAELKNSFRKLEEILHGQAPHDESSEQRGGSSVGRGFYSGPYALRQDNSQQESSFQKSQKTLLQSITGRLTASPATPWLVAGLVGVGITAAILISSRPKTLRRSGLSAEPAVSPRNFEYERPSAHAVHSDSNGWRSTFQEVREALIGSVIAQVKDKIPSLTMMLWELGLQNFMQKPPAQEPEVGDEEGEIDWQSRGRHTSIARPDHPRRGY